MLPRPPVLGLAGTPPAATPVMSAPGGIGAAVAGKIKKEQAYQAARNSPTGQAVLGQKQAPAATAAAPSQQQKIASGLAGITARNKSNMASLGLQTDKSGNNQITDKTQLGTGSLAGQSTRASGLAGEKPAVAAAAPSTPAAPPPAIPPVGIPTAPSSVAVAGAAGPALGLPAAAPPPVMPPPADLSPEEAALDADAQNLYAEDKLGMADWQAKVNGPRRGFIARGGEFNGMTQGQALTTVARGYEKLSPQEKQKLKDRSRTLRPAAASGLRGA